MSLAMKDLRVPSARREAPRLALHGGALPARERARLYTVAPFSQTSAPHEDPAPPPRDLGARAVLLRRTLLEPARRGHVVAQQAAAQVAQGEVRLRRVR